jgi:acyl-coenzyme A thioesterase PaaI-like protein
VSVSQTGPAEAPDARLELAAALRRVVTAAVAAPLDDETIAAAAATVTELAERLDARAGPGRRPRDLPDFQGEPQAYFPTSPAIGLLNPLAPPVLVYAEDGEIRGTAWFDHAYEGPPGCVHGGVIAMAFDDVLGAANVLAVGPGMTGTLSVRYRRPTPLRTPLRLEARVVERTGRRVHTWGGIFLGDELTAEAEAVFVRLAPDRILRIVEQHDGPARGPA